MWYFLFLVAAQAVSIVLCVRKLVISLRTGRYTGRSGLWAHGADRTTEPIAYWISVVVLAAVCVCWPIFLAFFTIEVWGHLLRAGQV